MEKIDSAFIYDVPNHEEHKKNIIELIRKIPQNKFDDISHTDWNLPPTMQKDWQHYFNKNIYIYFEDAFKDLINFKVVFENAWFQWYEKNDKHDWHTHPRCHFTSIYYLNLPDKNIKTIVKDFDNFKDFDIKEGQILTFPSFWSHKSPPNNFEEAKIIISFNTNIEI
tara:strand:- start:43 stop:543 length:501 start_codon:yes stop_codon:yes gene_type:complete